MPVLRVTELPDGRRMRINDRIGFVATRVYEVLTDNKNIGQSYVMFAPGIPRVRAFYLTDDERHEGLLVRDVEPVQDREDLFRWRVTVSYSTSTTDPLQAVPGGGGGGGGAGGGGGSPSNDSPILEPPTWNWTTVRDLRLLEKEFDESDENWEGRPVVNTAGQLFSPRPTVDDSRIALTYTRNEIRFDPNDIYYYKDTVNSHPFLDWAVGQVKLSHISAQPLYRNAIRFHQVTRLFEFKEPGWDLRLINQGTQDARGNPFWKQSVQQVRYLDEFGDPLPDDTENPIVLTYRSYRRVDFRPLGIILF